MCVPFDQPCIKLTLKIIYRTECLLFKTWERVEKRYVLVNRLCRRSLDNVQYIFHHKPLNISNEEKYDFLHFHKKVATF